METAELIGKRNIIGALRPAAAGSRAIMTMAYELAAALIGASAVVVAGGIGIYAAVVGEPLRQKYYGPKLTTSFASDDAHTVEAPTATYVRVAVVNKGKNTAANCRAYLKSAYVVQGGKRTKALEGFNQPLALRWSLTNDSNQAISLPPGIPHFVDVVKFFRQPPPHWAICTNTIPESIAEKLKSYRGSLSFTVVVVADGGTTSTTRIDVDYDGDWHNVKASSRTRATHA